MDGSPMTFVTKGSITPHLFSHSLHVRRGSSTSDNLNQFSGNDGLSSTVEENLVLVDHLTSVLRGVLRELSVPAMKVTT